MANPWEEISLEDYEGHMTLASVQQIQTLNCIMKQQFDAYPVATAMVLGVAGGNGLEHVQLEKFNRVYGIDINADYLAQVAQRYKNLEGILECLRVDLYTNPDALPTAELVIANLLIEYIGYEAFQNAIQHASPKYISCVIQINTGEGSWVSDSPYIHAFDGLDEVHHQMEESALTSAMEQIGYKQILQQATPLPNGKGFVRQDFKRA